MKTLFIILSPLAVQSICLFNNKFHLWMNWTKICFNWSTDSGDSKVHSQNIWCPSKEVKNWPSGSWSGHLHIINVFSLFLGVLTTSINHTMMPWLLQKFDVLYIHQKQTHKSTWFGVTCLHQVITKWNF